MRLWNTKRSAAMAFRTVPAEFNHWCH